MIIIHKSRIPRRPHEGMGTHIYGPYISGGGGGYLLLLSVNGDISERLIATRKGTPHNKVNKEFHWNNIICCFVIKLHFEQYVSHAAVFAFDKCDTKICIQRLYVLCDDGMALYVKMYMLWMSIKHSWLQVAQKMIALWINI